MFCIFLRLFSLWLTAILEENYCCDFQMRNLMSRVASKLLAFLSASQGLTLGLFDSKFHTFPPLCHINNPQFRFYLADVHQERAPCDRHYYTFIRIYLEPFMTMRYVRAMTKCRKIVMREYYPQSSHLPFYMPPFLLLQAHMSITVGILYFSPPG